VVAGALLFMKSEPTTFGFPKFRYKKTSKLLAFKLVAGAGFEPTTFGL
jgi:hypothetical protein